MNKKTITTATVLGVIAIIFGAFGAHALKNVVAPEQLITFETGVRYQMYHALFLLFVGLLTNLSEKAIKTIHNLVLAGVILFSGSIYLLATNVLTAFDFKTIGFVTPIGGALLIAAWLVLLFQNLKKKS
jgi:uncharacterized membrane protein YgdD (TMEM256/DUF423 family)